MSQSPTELRDGEIELGFVSGVFGVKGEVRVHLHNRESRFFRTARPIQLVSPSGARRQSTLSCRSGAGRRILGRIESLSTPEDAAGLKDWRIVIQDSQLPPPDAGQFYVRDIIGAEVHCEQQRVGTVAQVHTHGPADLFEIHSEDEVYFIPALSEFILNLDLDNQIVHVSPEALT